MKNKKKEDYNKIKKLISYMDFATRLKIAQEDNKRKRLKKKK